MERSSLYCFDVKPEHSASAMQQQKDTLDGLFVEINEIEKQHASKHRSRKIAHHLQPFVSFIERYASAVDVAVQGTLNPASLIWGSLRAMLVVTKSYSKYFDRVIATLERLGLVVSVFSEYETIIGNSSAFRRSICLVYTDIIEFLTKSRKIFRKPGVNLFTHSIWRDFETEFQDILNTLSIHIEALRDQATLAYRQKLYQSLDSQTRLTSEFMRHFHAISEQDKREEVLRWLCPSPASEVLARETAKKLCPSGSWLFATSEFHKWRFEDTRILWLNGVPGTGKTILSTSIIEELARTADETNGLAYFFCDKNDQSSGTFPKIMSTLTYQLIQHSNKLPPPLTLAFEQSQRSGRVRVSEDDKPLELLKSALQSYRKVCIVLDGLDESIETGRVIHDLRQLVQTSNTVSILIVSRDSSETRNLLSRFPEIRITSSQTQTDLDSFVSLAVGSSTFAQSDGELGSKVSQKLQSSAHGIFLWASLMLEHLKTASSPREVENSLLQLPAGLSGIYTSRLRSISVQGRAQRELFKDAACWILCVMRPLSLPELCTALATRLTTGISEFDRSQKPFPGLVAGICSQFFVVDPANGIVRPFHASVADYLLGTVPDGNKDKDLEEFFLAEDECHQRISQGCLALLAAAFDTKRANSAINEPLTRYACLSWLQHVIESTYNRSTHRMIIDFMISDCRQQWIWYFLQWQRNVFPLQRLFSLQSKLLVWLAEPTSIELPIYLDWASDVILILLDYSNSTHMSCENEDSLRNSTAAHYIESLTHFERMMVVRDLSRHLNSVKRLQHGVRLFESAYKMQEAESDGSDVSFTWLLNSLAVLYDQEGHVEKATETQEKALSILSRTPKSDIREVVWTQNELGRMYRHQSRLIDAENMHLKALQAMNGTTAGVTTDLEIAWTLSTLGRVYRKQCRFTESISQTRRALEIRQLLLGNEHPHCLWLLGDIAQCHFENGEYDLALHYHREAYAGRKQTLGDEHPDTLWTMNSIGVVLARRAVDRDVAEAVKLQKTALEGQRRILGLVHRHTKWTEAVLRELEGRAR